MTLNLNLERLRRDCIAAIPRRVPSVFAQTAEYCLEQECKVISKLGKSEEFLAAVEIGRFARREGIPCRLVGAGCSFIIAYLTGLSDVNPVSHELLFQRFRDFEGVAAPPFMFEIPKERCQEVVYFANQHYGPETVKTSFSFLEMLDDVKIPYLVAQKVRERAEPSFELGNIWRICSFHEDRRVFPMLWEGMAEGVYWLEKPDVQDTLRRLEPQSVQGIAALMAVQMISLDQPRILEEYLQRAYEYGQPENGLEMISECVSDTFGLIVYQEQIMRVMCWLGETNLSEGYRFALAAATRNSAEVTEYRNRFVTNAAEHIGEDAATRLFNRMVEAGQYACCKSHYTAEAVTAYQALFLKHRYPDQFQQVLEEVRGKQ